MTQQARLAFRDVLHTYANPNHFSAAVNEIKQIERNGGHLTQAEKSAIARGQEPTEAQAVHLEMCSDCTTYVTLFRNMLPGKNQEPQH